MCAIQSSLKKTRITIIIVCEIVAFGQIKVEIRGENTQKNKKKGGGPKNLKETFKIHGVFF